MKQNYIIKMEMMNLNAKNSDLQYQGNIIQNLCLIIIVLKSNNDGK